MICPVAAPLRHEVHTHQGHRKYEDLHPMETRLHEAAEHVPLDMPPGRTIPQCVEEIRDVVQVPPLHRLSQLHILQTRTQNQNVSCGQW